MPRWHSAKSRANADLYRAAVFPISQVSDYPSIAALSINPGIKRDGARTDIIVGPTDVKTRWAARRHATFGFSRAPLLFARRRSCSLYARPSFFLRIQETIIMGMKIAYIITISVKKNCGSTCDIP